MKTIQFAPKPGPVVEHIVFIRWECPNCGQRLGDVMGDRVVIKMSDRRISIPLREGVDQACWKCGTHSELRMIE